MRVYLFIAAVAGGATWLVTPLIRHLAIRIGAVGKVRARDVHTIPTPRMGGLGMLVGFVVAMLFASHIPFISGLFTANQQAWVVLAGAVMICLLGMADDLWDLDWMLKLAGQLLISVFVAWGGLQIISLPLGSLVTASPTLSMAITAFLIVASINAVNFVDGLDGLAAGVVAIVSLGMFYLMLARGAYSIALACLAIVGACLGFLRYNFHPASVFMGDSGSMLLGIAVGIVSVLGVVRGQSFTIMLVPLLMAAVPVLDTVSSIVRRLRAHTSIGSADMGHIHHRLMKAGLGQLRSVLVLWTCTAVLVLAACIMDSLPTMVNWIVLVVLAVPTFFVISKFGLFRPVLRHHYDNKGRFGPRRPRERR